MEERPGSVDVVDVCRQEFEGMSYKCTFTLTFAFPNAILLQREAVVKHWHLIVPPILTALDEGDTLSKAYACEILSHVIRCIDHNFLERTGLGDVFEEAISPCLHFLPPLTPINEAITVFRAGMAALLTLSACRYTEIEEEKRFKALDKILRDGVFHGMTYVSEN